MSSCPTSENETNEPQPGTLASVAVEAPTTPSTPALARPERRPPSRHLRQTQWLLVSGLLVISGVLIVGSRGGAVVEAIGAVEALGVALFVAVGGVTGLSAARHIPEYFRAPVPASPGSPAAQTSPATSAGGEWGAYPGGMP